MPIIGNTASGGKKPTTPTIGTATDGGTGTTVSVAFTPSTYIGKGTITYTATSSPGSLTGTGASSPITVSGLTTGTAYTFTVKGNTNYGVASDNSAASNSVTPASPSSFESIATATGTGSSGVITFSSIPSTYKHLQIRTLSRATGTGTGGADIKITFNSDTSSNYRYHHIVGNGATVTAGTGTSSILAKDSCVGGGVASGIHGVGIFDIHDYASTTKNKTLRGFNGWNNNTTTTYIYLLSGLYESTSAISSITLELTSNSFATTTVFGLYGIKGA